ncbi:MAG: histidine phosphatase family protein [Trueperaceae bacterium]|nr:histidine phosphatase family protein [Trueperaceae bacterium]
MRLYFIRHGEPDYTSLGSPGLGTRAHDLAPLTPIGRVQIDTIARDYRLQEVDAVLSSSYARSLESAALLARSVGKPFFVEVDLHEWRAHADPARELDPELLRRAGERLKFGEDPGEGPWETLDEVRARALNVLRRYRRFAALAVVTHAVVIASVVGRPRPVDHAEIVPFDLDPDAPPPVRRTGSPKVG